MNEIWSVFLIYWGTNVSKNILILKMDHHKVCKLLQVLIICLKDEIWAIKYIKKLEEDVKDYHLQS